MTGGVRDRSRLVLPGGVPTALGTSATLSGHQHIVIMNTILIKSRQILLLRLAYAVPVTLCATFVIYGLIQLVPGDPAITLAGEFPRPEDIERIRQLYKLDQPWVLQYLFWLEGAVQGDLGTSLNSGVPVSDIVLNAFPTTLLVVVMALTLSILIGVPLGVISAIRPGFPSGMIARDISSLGVSIPNFWVAMLLVYYFSLNLRWFPATGAVPLSESYERALWHAALPAIALSVGGMAEIARQLRSALVEMLNSQFVRTLYAKGLPIRSIVWKHGLKNVSVNLLTVVGLQFNRLLGATVIVEAVFALPGIGSALATAAINKDFPIIQGMVLVVVLLVISINLIVDILCSAFDPRL